MRFVVLTILAAGCTVDGGTTLPPPVYVPVGDRATAGGDPASPADDIAQGDGDALPADPGPVGDPIACGDPEPGGDPFGHPWQIGTPDTWEIGTWNLRNFPTVSATTNHVGGLLTILDLDMVVFQEIEDVDAFATLEGQLPGYDSVVSAHTYGDTTYQKIALLYRASVVQVRAHRLLFIYNGYVFPRPPLEIELDLVPPCGPRRSVTVIAVHLKAGVAEEDETRRRTAVSLLKSHVDDILAAGTEDEVILLGDFNDEVTDPAADNVFTVISDDPADYVIATEPLETAGDVTYLPFSRFYDHIIHTDALAPDRTMVVELDDLITSYSYRTEISDHQPTVATFLW